ncbi:MAG: alpha/beta hydrolase [Actinobacteria bacterium]|nr:alpha/beta hydrolase [Actinomycetota bacterium]MBW3651587.1 alpha/beta hydrolase [Actinomycetota bacterium]
MASERAGLHVVDEGAGRPVVLLHGFPDSAAVWRHQSPALVDAGFRTIAPDLRGFGRSPKPERVEEYAVTMVVGDVLALMDDLGVEQADVVGHDWGSAVGWVLAAIAPDRVRRLVAVSVGHPAVRPHLGVEQREKSWYMLFFQFPEAEQLLAADDWKLFRQLLREDGDMDSYLADLSRPGALTAALNWYRANLSPRLQLSPPPPLPPVTVPVMGIWSTGDHYLVEDHVRLSERFVSGPWRYERIEGASHWIPLDAPERLNELLIDFLSADGAE